MKKGGGSQKGASFERTICKKLSKWWTDGEHDDVFWRTQGSGARATVRCKQGLETHGQQGDVQSTHPEGQPLLDHFAFELKRGYDFRIDHVLQPKKWWKSQLYKIMAKLGEEAGYRHRALVYKPDHRPELVFTSPTFLDGFVAAVPEHVTYIRVSSSYLEWPDDFILMTFEDWMDCLDEWRLEMRRINSVD